MTDPQEDPSDFSAEAILAAHGRKVQPRNGPGRHAWKEVKAIPVAAGQRQAEPKTDDVDQARPVWWRQWLADYGLIPPVTAGR